MMRRSKACRASSRRAPGRRECRWAAWQDRDRDLRIAGRRWIVALGRAFRQRSGARPHDTKPCGAKGVCLRVTVSTALPSKTSFWTAIGAAAGEPPCARHTSSSALKRFFAIADAWELSPLQQCRLLKIPSPQVLQRYRLGQAPRLSATQQERAALIANIQYSLTADPGPKDRAWAWVHAPSPQAAVRRRQPALLHAGKRPAGAARGGPASGSRKRAS